jgi:hypothetical protein
VLDQFIRRDSDVLGDLTEQDRGNIATLMKWNRRTATSGIAKLLVRSALADFDETELHENGNNLTGLADGNVAITHAMATF